MTPIELPDIASSQSLGEKIAQKLCPGDVVTLSGSLGMGKTSIARAIIKGLGFEGDVTSPSFTIVEQYDPPDTRLLLSHLDLYRVKESSELDELDLDDIGVGRVALIEWPEHASDWLARFADNILAIHLEAAANGRTASCHWGSNWNNRILWT